MNELEQLASSEEVLITMVSQIRELSEDEKIRQQCAARADYESRLVSQYNQGIKQGIEQGIEQGIAQGKYQLLFALYRDGEITIESASKRLNITAEEFLKLYEQSFDK